MGSFERACNRSLPETKCDRGLEQMGKYCVWYQNRSLGRWPVNHIRSQARGITSTTGCIGESGFDPVELWVMGPPRGLRVGREVTSCTIMSARHVRG